MFAWASASLSRSWITLYAGFIPGLRVLVRNARIHLAASGYRHIECLNLLVDRFQQAIPGLGRRQACPEAGARNGQARRPPDPIRENA